MVGVMPDPSKPPDWMVEQIMKANERFRQPPPPPSTELADLRARLELFREHVCQGCGCACGWDYGSMCEDCCRIVAWSEDPGDPCHSPWVAGASISVGMRALCGRRVFP